MRILKAFQRFTKKLLNFHSDCPFTWELENLFDCLFVILSNAINKSSKTKILWNLLRKILSFLNTASDTVEAFSLNSSIQISHQILSFLLKYSLGLALMPPHGGHSSPTPRRPRLPCYSSLLSPPSFKQFILSLHCTAWLIFLSHFHPPCHFLRRSCKGLLLTGVSSWRFLVCSFRDPLSMAVPPLCNSIYVKPPCHRIRALATFTSMFWPYCACPNNPPCP